MVNFQYKDHYTVDDFRRIITILRSEDGCPWDHEQTHESIRRNFLEEVCEAIEAINEQSTEHLIEELGDVLMQVIFHADIEREKGVFDLDDVADAACKKLIFRHPHVFGDVSVSGADQVLENWEVLKRREKSQETVTDTLNAVSRTLPMLWRAEKVQKKAAKAGIDCSLSQAGQNLTETAQAVAGGDMSQLGKLLWNAVWFARHTETDPEYALQDVTEDFISRFSAAEKDMPCRPEELEADRQQELGEKLYH